MRDSSGKAFIIQVDPSDVSMPTPTAEFAGITSDSILENETLAAPIEQIEYEGWLVFEEEPKATVDWNTHTKPSDVAAISEISPINQNNRTPISLDDLPFYVDTGATVHISPERSDFLTLKPTTARSVKGVGGSSVTAIGMGNIKLLRCTRRLHHLTKCALHPKRNSTLYISQHTRTRQSGGCAFRRKFLLDHKQIYERYYSARYPPSKQKPLLPGTPFCLRRTCLCCPTCTRSGDLAPPPWPCKLSDAQRHG